MRRSKEAMSNHLENREELRPAPELFRVHPEDISLVADDLRRLFTQPETIEHLTGITPTMMVEEIISRYEIKPYEQEPSLHLIVAQDAEEKLVGTITVQAPPRAGVLVADLSLLAVDKDHRQAGLGKRLIRAGAAVIVGPKEKDGLAYQLIRAAVMLGPEGDWIPQRLLRSEHYESGTEQVRSSESWSNREGRFVTRNVLPFTLTRQRYYFDLQQRRGSIQPLERLRP